MKIHITARTLHSALARVMPVIQSRSSMPILGNVLIEHAGSTLAISGTDMDIRVSTAMRSISGEPGSALIPAKRLADTVAMLDGELTITTTDARATITSKTGTFKLPVDDPKDFPQSDTKVDTFSIDLAVKDLQAAIGATLYAVSHDEFRPAMTGVFIDGKVAVATDGFRLARHRLAIELPAPMIVPPRALGMVMKLSGDLVISGDAKHLRFSDGETTITTRLIDENYPQYESVIPQSNPIRCEVNRADLAAAVRRVSMYANGMTGLVRFIVAPTSLAIATEDIDTAGEATETIDCDATGEITIGFNGRFVAELLEHLTSERVTFHFSTNTRPAVVMPLDSGDPLTLLMPIRLEAK